MKSIPCASASKSIERSLEGVGIFTKDESDNAPIFAKASAHRPEHSFVNKEKDNNLRHHIGLRLGSSKLRK
ncbi:hypothetical protein L195_g050266, partial [Trifolium pratense]